MAPWGRSLADPSPLASLDELAKRVEGGLRLRIDESRLRSLVEPGKVELGDGRDLRRDLLDLLTGDVALYTVGRGPFAGKIALGVREAARVRKAIPGLCNLLFKPFGRIVRLDDDHCKVVLQLPSQLATEPIAQTILSLLSGVTVSLTVRDSLLVVDVGDVEVGKPRPVSEVTGPGWQLAAWLHSLDPLATAPPSLTPFVADLLALLEPDQRAEIAGVRWALSHLAQVGVGIRFGSLKPGSGQAVVGQDQLKGLHLLVTATAFAADPPEVYALYQAAVAEQHRGDLDAYRAAMAEIARIHPESLAGRQGASVVDGAPVMGPGVALVLAVGIPALKQHVEGEEPGRRRSNR